MDGSAIVITFNTTGRGQPGKYVTRYTKEEIKRLSLNKETVHLYGREQQVNYRTAVAKARFLNGQSVCFVWCEFEDSKGKKDRVYYCQQICS